MRFSYAVVALIGAANAMPRVGSLVTGRSVCNNAEDCKGVARAVVADQAAIDARQQSRQAKSDAANATAKARSVNNNKDKKRSKKLFQETNEARALGDTVDTLVGDVTGTVGDVTGSVGLKTRDGNEVRAAVTDDAAIDARQQSRQAKSAAANGTAEARSVHERAAVTDDAAIDARQQSRQAKSAAANGTAEARSVNEERAAVTDDAAIDARQQSKEAKSAAANGTAEARSVNGNKGRSANLIDGIGADGAALTKKDRAAAEAPKSRKSRKSRRSHQLW